MPIEGRGLFRNQAQDARGHYPRAAIGGDADTGGDSAAIGAVVARLLAVAEEADAGFGLRCSEDR